ncbi:hypothetical protein LCGC14_0611050 [marine sediment metagenome]|uniref:Uncharacterized protein n=1 Tax=marine sediment metagenome TaxID=412755 RepID=A0A0F9UG23_9ZZZZ
MRRISLLPRWIHRWYAHLLGYFWLPCPICKRKFGGHEITGASVQYSTGLCKCICPACGEEAVQKDKERRRIR